MCTHLRTQRGFQSITLPSLITPPSPNTKPPSVTASAGLYVYFYGNIRNLVENCFLHTLRREDGLREEYFWSAFCPLVPHPPTTNHAVSLRQCWFVHFYVNILNLVKYCFLHTLRRGDGLREEYFWSDQGKLRESRVSRLILLFIIIIIIIIIFIILHWLYDFGNTSELNWSYCNHLQHDFGNWTDLNCYGDHLQHHHYNQMMIIATRRPVWRSKQKAPLFIIIIMSYYK